VKTVNLRKATIELSEIIGGEKHVAVFAHTGGNDMLTDGYLNSSNGFYFSKQYNCFNYSILRGWLFRKWVESIPDWTVKYFNYGFINSNRDVR
jgi:hypothetical protein